MTCYTHSRVNSNVVCIFSPVIMLAVLTAVLPLGRLADPATRDWSFTMGTEIKQININHIFISFFCNNKQNVVGSKRGLTEVGVIHGLPGRQPSLVVVAQQLVKEIQSLGADEVLVLTVDEPLPPLTRMPRIEKQLFRNETCQPVKLKPQIVEGGCKQRAKT